MELQVREWGTTEDGRTASRIDVVSDTLTAVLTDYGARLVELHVPDASGSTADVVLGYDDLAAYESATPYVGATCGRYGNRIGAGSFRLGEVTHRLDINEAPNHLHGGRRGFDRLIWDLDVDETAGTITFSLESPDGDQGYPGTVLATTTYRFEGPVVTIEMTAVTDRTTIVNLVHHSYWNLGGHASGPVVDHELQIEADHYTPVDDELIPTGELSVVDGTPFDFRTRRPIGDAVAYDHNWVLRTGAAPVRRAAILRDPGSGRMLTVETTEPGLQFYAGGGLPADLVAKGGGRYGPNAGLALETQRFPDSPNHDGFPDATLVPGDRYRHELVLAFTNG